MSKKKCDPLAIRGVLTELTKNPDGTKRTPEELIAAIKKHDTRLVKEHGIHGFKDAVQHHIDSQNKDITLTPDEYAEFDAYVIKFRGIVEKGGNILTDPTISSLDREAFSVLLLKAKNSTVQGKVTINGLAYILNALNPTPDTAVSVDVIVLLENALEIATRSNDTKAIERYTKALAEVKKTQTLSSKLKIDWAALDSNHTEQENLLVELSFLSALSQLGDEQTTKDRKKVETSITILNSKIRMFMKNRREEEEDSDDDYLDDGENDKELISLKQKLRQAEKTLQETFSDNAQTTREIFEKRITEIRIQLESLEQNSVENNYISMVMATMGIRKDYYITSLRDIKQRSQKIHDQIDFVRGVIKNHPDDKGFTEGEAARLFGGDTLTLTQVRLLFHENKLNEDGSPVLTAKGTKAFQKKATVTREDMMKIFSIWKDLMVAQIYDNTYDLEEQNRIAELLNKGDKRLISSVQPGDVQPTTRSRVDALKTQAGRKYDGNNLQDRIELIADLQAAIGRLNTVSTLNNLSGFLPEWALVSVLGMNAQSLFTLFDPAIMDPQDILDDDDLKAFNSESDKVAAFELILKNLGVDPSSIRRMPEMSEPDSINDFSRIVSFKLHRDSKTGQIISASLVVIQNGEIEKTIPFSINEIPTEGSTFSSENATDFLNVLNEYQDAGFKVVGHNSLAPDGDFSALASTSGNVQLALQIAMRSYDTAMLAFKGGPTSQYTRFKVPGIDVLLEAYSIKANGVIPTDADIATLHAAKDHDAVKQGLEANAIATGLTLLGMANRGNQVIEVKDTLTDPNKSQSLKIGQVVPTWFDQGPPGLGFHKNFRGMSNLFDIGPFQNLRNSRGLNFGSPITYSISKVENIIMNLLIMAIEETNPDEVNSILSGLIATPSQIEKHYDLVIKLSERNYEGYMPIKLRFREENKNRFMLEITKQRGDVNNPNFKGISIQTTDDEVQYRDRVIKEIFSTFKAYHRDAKRELQKFSELVGFREYDEKQETMHVYIAELFSFAYVLFNERPATLVQMGNGEVDYVSATQLGRGFAQVILGHIKDGNTLSQNIETPLREVAETREDQLSKGVLLSDENLAGDVTTRSYLPLGLTNVSYFAPMSLFQQERAYGDWALRNRYKHILARDISESDLKAFREFQKTNKMDDLNSAIRVIRVQIKEITAKLAISPTNEELQFQLKEAKTAKRKAVAAFDAYMEKADDERLEQGRVQRYSHLNQVNNRDIYTRIPTAAEAIEMSVEVALNLPEFIASLVHDSVNFQSGAERHLAKPFYIKDAAVSAGGPVGRATWAGINSLIGHMLMNPQVYSTKEDGSIDISKDVVEASIRSARKAMKDGTMGYSKGTYWDDGTSGIHHLLAMQHAYAPSSSNLRDLLLKIQAGEDIGVSQADLDDYYKKSYEAFMQKIDQLISMVGRDPKWETNNAQEDIAILTKLKEQLETSNEKRDFFKGTVIPVVYSGGQEGIISDLRKRRGSLSNDDALKDLSDRGIEIIADVMTKAGILVNGRLIDNIIGFDADRVKILTESLISEGKELKERYLLNTRNLVRNHSGFNDGVISVETLREAIRERIRYVASVSLPPVRYNIFKNPDNLSKEQKVSLEALRKNPKYSEFVQTSGVEEAMRQYMIDEETVRLENKWSARINEAMGLIKKYHESQGLSTDSMSYSLSSDLAMEINVVLAGGEHQYKTQASLAFLNKIQSTGYEVNATDEAFLEHMVKTGRNIEKEDVMFQDMTVHMEVGLGTTTRRMEMIGNTRTSVQGGSLSKGYRIELNEDGTVNFKKSVVNSMWTLRNNPMTAMSIADARAHAEKMAAKDYALRLSTDYAPTYLGYNKEESESREQFFQDWSERSKRERTFSIQNLRKDGPMRVEMKNLYMEQQRRLNIPEDKIKELTDDVIDNYIKSNSVPFASREGIRSLAPTIAPNSGDIITGSDASGLGAFIPRIADHDILDAGIHGLFSMRVGSQRFNRKGGQVLTTIRRAKKKTTSVKNTIDSINPGSSVYDAKDTPYIPVSNNSLTEIFTHSEAPINSKVNQLRHLLDTFAIESGLEDLVNNKEYARLYQIYQLDRKLKKQAKVLDRFAKSSQGTRELRMLHRNFIVDMWKMTKFQRDAKGMETNLLDLKKAVAIDPTLFKYADGSNMRYLDALVVMSKLGISALDPIKFHLSPTEHVAIGVENEPNVLKSVSTIVKPFVVQGRDVAQLILAVLSDESVKRQATKIATQWVKDGKLKSFQKDTQGFIVLSSIPTEMDSQLLEAVFSDDALISSAANNLNIYVTLNIGVGDPKDPTSNRAVFNHSVSHASTQTDFVTTGSGLGDVTANRIKTGPEYVQFLFTAEGVKRLLVGARNQGAFARLELAVQMDKYIGIKTNVNSLRTEAMSDFGDRHLQQVSEETEILAHLHGDNNPKPLKRIVDSSYRSSLRDELGLDLNPYDAEYYFTDDGSGNEGKSTNPSYKNLTPYRTALLTPIRRAIIQGQNYPTLAQDVKELESFYSGGNVQLMPVGMLIHLKSNTSGLTEAHTRILLEESMGVEQLKDEDFEGLMDTANKIMELIDKINHAPFKGKNPYLASALKLLNGNPNAEISSYDLVSTQKRAPEGQLFIHKNKISGAPNSKDDYNLRLQAIVEAKGMTEKRIGRPDRYGHIDDQDLIEGCYNADSFQDAIFPGGPGSSINSTLSLLIKDKVITEDVAVFYRYMLGNILKKNPNLVSLISIELGASTSTEAASAIKKGDRFIIRLNTNIMKQLGTVDQLRVFAHEAAHIARLAFIRDNSNEWRKIEALLRSSKGRASISVMLLAMNGGAKYEGYERDMEYYISHPEEFAAQWGGWMLFNKTFSSRELLDFLTKRNRGSVQVTKAWSKALAIVEAELVGLGIGLKSIDEGTLTAILDMVESMFGFTSEASREIYVENRDQQLFLVRDMSRGITSLELLELEHLKDTGSLDHARITELESLNRVGGIRNLDLSEYQQTRGNREHNQSDPTGFYPGTSVTPLGDMTKLQQLEIIKTFASETAIRNHAISRPDNPFHTMGGLSRAMAMKIWKPETVDWIISTRSLVLNLGRTGAHHTYDNASPFISGLMHVIGNALSNTQHQFLTSEGDKGIKDNRNFSRQWVDRIANETERLRVLSKDSREDFELLRVYAYETAMGIARTPIPAHIKIEAKTQADALARTLQVNSTNIKEFIFGNGSRFLENVPSMFDSQKIGSSSKRGSKALRAQNANNRAKLIEAISKQIIENANSGNIDATAIYVTGILPRLNDKQETDQDFIKELDRVRSEHPEAFEFLRLAVIQHLKNSKTMDTATATSFVTSALNDPGYIVPGSLHLGRASSPLILNAFLDVTNKIYKTAHDGRAIGFLTKKLNVDAQVLIKPLVNALTNGQVNMASRLFSTDGSIARISVNQYVLGVTGTSVFFNRSAISSDDSLVREGTPAMVLASIYAADLGESAKFMNTKGLLTGKNLAGNPELSEFISTKAEVMVYEIERRQGFHAASKNAVFTATGIAGISIADIISLARAHADSMILDGDIKATEKSKADFLTALDSIEEKLYVEQGLAYRNLSKTSPVLKAFVEYGPDVTRLTYGANLNTASLMMEGLLGGYITMVYNGNVVQFMTTMMGSFFGTYRLSAGMSRLEERGFAVNLMLGMERTMENSRESLVLTSSPFEQNASALDMIRTWFRHNNNRGYQGVINALTQQAQLVLVKGLRNGDLAKLRKIFSSGTVTNISQLKIAMRDAGVQKIKPHVAQEMNGSGLFAGDTLEIYTWLLANTKSTDINDGTLDIPAALRGIESTNWGDGTGLALRGIFWDRKAAYETTMAVYNFNKRFRDVVTVDPNAWDSATSSDAFSIMFNFYRQYPNLFAAQKVIRLGGRMELKHWVPMMVSSIIIDLIYNLLLMVAAGSLPLAALLPWEEDFIGRKNPWKLVRLILSRNPIFGLGVTPLAGAVSVGFENYEKSENKRYMTELGRVKGGVRAGLNELDPSFVAWNAATTIGAPLLALAINAPTQVGGNMNAAEEWELKNTLLGFIGRATPFFNELPIRTSMQTLLGERPNTQRFSGLGGGSGFKAAAPRPSSPSVSRPTTRPTNPPVGVNPIVPDLKKSLENNTNPITVPKGFSRL